MLETIAGLLGGLLGGSAAQKKQNTEAAQRAVDLQHGKQIRVPCALRYEGESYWRHGDMILSHEDAAWAPPAMSSRTVSLNPQRIRITGVRKPTFKETLDIDASCRILSCQLEGQKFELAIPRIELIAVSTVFDIGDPATPHQTGHS